MATNTKTGKQTFRQFVEERISAADFNILPETLGLSIRKTNFDLKDPRKMKLSTITKLSEVMGNDLSKVIDQFKIGYDRLTVNEYKNLTKQD
jgi:hypothetical protein